MDDIIKDYIYRYVQGSQYKDKQKAFEDMIKSYIETENIMLEKENRRIKVNVVN